MSEQQTAQRIEVTEAEPVLDTGAEADRGEDMATAIRAGASQAREDVAQVIPKVGAWLGKGLYSSCYYASYDVVFGALTIGRSIPKDSPMLRAIQDGAADARRKLEQRLAAAERTETDEGLGSPTVTG